MGSLARKLKREKAKRAHESLKVNWNAEKRAQEQILRSGEELPQNTPRLGKRPNFKQFLEILRKMSEQSKIEAAKQAVKDREELEGKLDWEEEVQTPQK